MHVWEVGVVSLHSAMSRAMADKADTGQRAAARSALASALVTFGVEGDPSRASVAHLAGVIETSLRRGACGYLGDAMLLSMALFERKVDTLARSPSNVPDSFATDRGERLWFWGDVDEGGFGPLSSRARHFASSESQLLFTPS